MAMYTIPDELDLRLQHAASARGCSKHDLVLEALEHTVEDADEPEVSPEHVALLRGRLDEARRNELVSFERVESKLLAFIAKRNVH